MKKRVITHEEETSQDEGFYEAVPHAQRLIREEPVLLEEEGDRPVLSGLAIIGLVIVGLILLLMLLGRMGLGGSSGDITPQPQNTPTLNQPQPQP